MAFKKKLISISMAFLIVFTTLLPVQNMSYGASPSEWKEDLVNGYYYDTSGVIEMYFGTAEHLVIPAKIGKVTIKKIGSSAFHGNSTLKSVTFPEGLTEIGDNAFGYCGELTTVKFPSTLKSIKEYGFDTCSKLTNVTFPSGLKEISDCAFLNCSSITEIQIPAATTTIGYGAFQGVKLKTFAIPTNISILPAALLADTNLTTIVIPSNIKTIEEFAFAMNPGLLSVTIPETVTTLETEIFQDSPNVKIYGKSGSKAQLYSSNYGIPFVDLSEAAASQTPVAPVIKKDAIVIPADAKGPSIAAKPSSTQLSVMDVSKKIKGYSINGADYYRITDLGLILNDSGLEFNPAYSDIYHAMILISDKTSTLKETSTIDGKDKLAYRTYPTILLGESNLSYSISVYSIDGNEYYKLTDLMRVLNCSLIKNTETGVLNINPKRPYEPLDSPVFAAVPNGNSNYMTLQKSLYDAYLKGQSEVAAVDVVVPDNTALYVPKGVTFGDGGNRKVTLGTNSSFIVRGNWNTEYPSRNLKAASSSTKNAVYTSVFNTIEPIDFVGAVNDIYFVSGENNYLRGNMPLKSAQIAYGAINNGVQSILLNITRDKKDPQNSVFVYFHVKGGESYGLLTSNVNESIDLTSQLAIVAAKNVGKVAVIDQILVQNANGVSLSKEITIPVNWTLSTSGPAPVDFGTVRYGNPIDDNYLIFDGLTKNSYIGKVEFKSGITYKILSPANGFSVIPYGNSATNGFGIYGKSTNVALFTGKKDASGENNYSCIISPFSKELNYPTNTK